MNKRLFVLICSIILFQNVYNDDACTSTASPSSNACEKITVSETKKCIYDEDQEICIVTDILCTEITSGATVDLCKKLKASEGKTCTLEGEKCVEKEKAKHKKTSSSNNLQLSLAFLIVLFLF